MNTLSNWGPVVVIILGYVIGFFFQNGRIDDLRESMNQRFSDLNSKMDGRFADMKDFIKSELSRLKDRIDRLEPPSLSLSQP
jgi:archaellum component FlaC